MSQSLTKTQRKLVSQGSSAAGKRLREKGRAARMIAVPAAIAIAKAEAVASSTGMIPSFPVPVLGTVKLTTLAGYAGCLGYMLSKNPGTGMTVIGLSSIALVARAQTA